MADHPNFIWILTDEQRRDSVGCYGAPWARTPNLDALAERGLRFDAAYTPSPTCVPARACMLTGQRASRLGVLHNGQRLADNDAHFLTEALIETGYETASFGKHHYNNRRRAFQTQAGKTLGDRVGYTTFHVPVDEKVTGVVYYPTEFRHWILAGRFPGELDDTPEMANCLAALEWIKSRDTDRPFLLRLSLNAPHVPVTPPAPFDSCIEAGAIDLPIDREPASEPAHITANFRRVAGVQRLTDAQIARTRQAYYGHAAFVDHIVGRFLAEAANSEDLGNTYIIYTADHGTHLGDHGFYQKQSYFEASVSVPLLVTGPDIAPGVVREPVSIGSLLPTILELAGLTLPAPGDFPSLAGVWHGEAAPTGPVLSEIDFGVWDYRSGDRYVMVRDGNWKLCVFPDSEAPDAMLFHLPDDPGERRNLADAPSCAHIRQQLLATLARCDQDVSSATGDTAS